MYLKVTPVSSALISRLLEMAIRWVLSRGNLREKSGDQDENWVPLSGVMIVAVAVTRKRFLAL